MSGNVTDEASGIWRMSDISLPITNNIWPGSAPRDPQFPNTVLLIPGNGANGGNNGTFLDSSSNNFTVTNNGVQQNTVNPYGTDWSVLFDGSSAISTSATQIIPATGAWTAEAWINLASYSAQSTIFSQGTGADAGRLAIFVGGYGDNVAVEISIGGTTYFPTLPLAGFNRWVHIAVQRTGSTISFYFDGIAQGTSTNSVSIQNTNFFIGRNNDGNNPFNGSISNVRISNIVRYTANFTPPTTAFVNDANTVLLTCQSNRFVDNSSNVYTLNRVGTPVISNFGPIPLLQQYNKPFYGGSGFFNGSSNFLSIANNANLAIGANDFCIECWFNSSSTGEQTFIGQWVTGSQNWILQYRTGPNELRFYYNSSNEIVGSFTLIPNQWNHIVVCRNGTNMSLYANGVRLATKTDSTSINNTTAINIGRNGDNLQYVSGYITNARLVVGSSVYDPVSSTLTVPTSSLTAIPNTRLLCNFTNANIIDNTTLNTFLANVVTTSVTQSRFGGTSLSFNGANTYIQCPTSTIFDFGSANFTVEAWIFIGPTSSTQVLLHYGSANNTPNTSLAWELRLNSAPALTASLYSGSTISSITSGTLTRGVWTHIAFVKNTDIQSTTATTRLYINGTSVGTPIGGNQGLNTPANRVLTIGAPQPVNTNFFDGFMTNIRITKGVARYLTNFNVPTVAFPTY